MRKNNSQVFFLSSHSWIIYFLCFYFTKSLFDSYLWRFIIEAKIIIIFTQLVLLLAKANEKLNDLFCWRLRYITPKLVRPFSFRKLMINEFSKIKFRWINKSRTHANWNTIYLLRNLLHLYFVLIDIV